MEWQDISTAPKDGTKVLVGRFVRKCQTDFNNIVTVDFWHTPKLHNFLGWGNFNTQHWPPTHWMPLPNPPRSEGC